MTRICGREGVAAGDTYVSDEGKLPQNSLKLKKIMQPVEIFVIASEGVVLYFYFILNIIIINRKRRDQKI
jgi:hypothetical protein